MPSQSSHYCLPVLLGLGFLIVSLEKKILLKASVEIVDTARMGRYRSRSRSYSPRRRSRSPPPRGRTKRYDDDRYGDSRSYRDRRSPLPSGLLVRNLPLDARSFLSLIDIFSFVVSFVSTLGMLKQSEEKYY